MSGKPLGRKAYGSIGHLLSSRVGPGDHHVHKGQDRICTEKARDKRDRIIVQEKLDGSCCAVAKVEGVVVALGRAGYLASSSRFVQHQYFAEWVRRHYDTFAFLLDEGRRFVGEWLAQAHGTLYDNEHPDWSPFVIFDLMQEHYRATYDELSELVGVDFATPHVISDGPPYPVEQLADMPSYHGADEPEGAVYRVERDGVVDYLAKWVRPGKIDGLYLPETSTSIVDSPVWQWTP